MTGNQLISLPPEESWLPGHLLGPVVLHESESLHVLVEDAEVYPLGILIHVTARFRSLPTLQGHNVTLETRSTHSTTTLPVTTGHICATTAGKSRTGQSHWTSS